ncbi:site-specific integrase [Clostridium perfringens]|uniref:site-specific integrase n=1 Tax=Clostridium perfringens TaxID=1502 RepID=UPI0018E44845|nr:site-specific integrase [Clostridium perfringens]MBI6108733.1 site-specific integrase [Clostridium perfringens]UUR88592.1 site-specific integrase [Clostridium perfringens]
MKDILENIDNIDEKIKEKEERKFLEKEAKKSAKEKFYIDKATEFAVKFEKLKQDPIVQEHFLGKFNNYESNIDGRVNNINLMIETARRLSNEGVIPEGHDLYVKDKYAKNLMNTSKGLYREFGNTNLKNNIDDKYRTNEAQGFLNEISIGKMGKDAPEGTAKNNKLRVQKLNLFEALGAGKCVDYSSGIQTRYETEEYKKNPKPKDEKNKQFRGSDYDRIREGIMEKLRTRPEKVTDPEVAFILAGDFMLRKDTIDKINVENIDAANGTIEIYDNQNKSKQAFLATASYTVPQHPDYTEALSLISQRAKIRNIDKRNNDGTIPVISCSEQFLYKGFNKIMREYDVKGTWKGKYHALRHMGAQRRYDEIRARLEEDFPLQDTNYWKIESLKELNYEMGHTAEHIDTTMGYVKNIW